MNKIDFPYHHLILYDGTCLLCHWSVKFILKYDNQKYFAFAPLQGEFGKNILKDLPAYYSEVDSIILLENFQIAKPQGVVKPLVKGKAIFRICWLLKRFFRVIGLFYWMPAILLDPFYSLVAKNRYSWFGRIKADKQEVCPLPDASQRSRFFL